MILDLDLSLNENKHYKSNSQIARLLTEAWFEHNMYCPACQSDHLDRLAANTKVLDFSCPRCEETYQLKAKSRPFGRSVANSEYHTKIEKIKRGLSPNWVFLRYDLDAPIPQVRDLFIIPKHFMTLESIQARRPLGPTARRAGWVGSNILLDRFPPDAKLYVISSSSIIPKTIVRDGWDRFRFLSRQNVGSKGWLNDVLICIRELNKTEFTLQDVYSFEERLQKLHPHNSHVRSKIRQQLQILRDNNILTFNRPGNYSII